MEEFIVNLAGVALVWLSGFLACYYWLRDRGSKPVQHTSPTCAEAPTPVLNRRAEREILEILEKTI